MADGKTEKPLKPINEMAFHLQEHRQPFFSAFVEKGTTLEDIMKRDFWAHVAAKVTVPAKIHVMAEDKSFYVELIVFAAYSNGLEVRRLGDPIVITERMPIPTEILEYEIEDSGLNTLWRVRRVRDNRVVKDKFQSKVDAEAWLRDYLKVTKQERVAA